MSRDTDNGALQEHEPVVDDAAAHAPVEHEGETAEHLALAQRRVAGEDLAHTCCKFLRGNTRGGLAYGKLGAVGRTTTA